MKRLIKIQFYILFLGALFAWTNFGLEFYGWINQKPVASCPIGAPTGNPFLASCFYGALVFTAALWVSVLLLKKSSEIHN